MSVKKIILGVTSLLLVFSFLQVTQAQELETEPMIIVPGISTSWNWNEMFSDVFANEWSFMYQASQYYNPLIDSLEDNGYEQGESLFVSFYDWRQPNQDSASEYLKATIDEALQKTGADQVDIIAHSMGGLVVRAYVQSDDYEGDVDDVVMLGTPNEGSSDVYEVWEGGNIPGEWDILSRQIIKAYLWFKGVADDGTTDRLTNIQNQIPSIKELLPTYDFLVDKETGDQIPVSDMQEQNEFLADLNSFDGVEDFSDRVNELYLISGTGQNTVNYIPVVPYDSSFGDRWVDGKPDPLDPEPNSLEGDNRVLLASADLSGLEPAGPPVVNFLYPLFGNSLANWLFTPAHAQSNDGPTVSECERDFVFDSSESDFFNLINCGEQIQVEFGHSELPTAAAAEIFTALDIATTTEINVPIYQEPEDVISFWIASPVAVVVTGPNGDTISSSTAKITGGEYRGASDPAGPKMIYIPEPADGEYTIELTSIGDGGEYHLGTAYFATNQEELIDTKQGTTTEGEVVTYSVTLDSTSATPTTVIKEPPVPETPLGLLSELEEKLNTLKEEGEVDQRAHHLLIKSVQRAAEQIERHNALQEKSKKRGGGLLKAVTRVMEHFQRTVNRLERQEELTGEIAGDLLADSSDIVEAISEKED